jgi:transcriptional regulator with XRE-family HTH domain
MDLDQLVRRSRVRRAFNPALFRARRLAARVSQAEIADLLGVAPSVVCRWESGQRQPRAAHAERYCEALDRLSAEGGHE